MDKNRHVDIMGIVNLTDDSYYSPSRCLLHAGTPADVENAAAAALKRTAALVEEGASVIDIGACSTRPGSLPVGETEEWRRLAPALRLIREAFPALPISIDTYWASVAEKAFDLIGHFIVNDVSAGGHDSRMLSVAGRLGLGYVAMHMRGDSRTMQSLTDYKDVTAEVMQYFRDFSLKAAAAGLSEWILDPGFGFAKTLDQNYELLRSLESFRNVSDADGNTPRILVGVSRKSMIYKLFGITPEESLPATQVLHLAALQNGADILRVHDVSEAVRTLSLYRKLA